MLIITDNGSTVTYQHGEYDGHSGESWIERITDESYDLTITAIYDTGATTGQVRKNKVHGDPEYPVLIVHRDNKGLHYRIPDNLLAIYVH